MRAFILETTATEPFLERIIRLKQQFWNYSAVSQRRWFAEHVREYDLHVIGDEAGRVLAYTRIAMPEPGERTAVVDTVCVDKTCHRRGVGLQIMTAANDAIAERQMDGLLSCAENLVAFYERSGWQRSTGPVDTTGKPLRQDEVIMHLDTALWWQGAAR